MRLERDRQQWQTQRVEAEPRNGGQEPCQEDRGLLQLLLKAFRVAPG